LTGEYAVLDGACALALPTKLGQSMTIKPTRSTDLEWTSLDVDGNTWFNSSISLYDLKAVETSDEAISENLYKILRGTVRLNCEFLDKWNAFKVETKLEFPRDWGLGSSSTLIYLIAKWADIEPLELYYKVENGSGYDVAAAGAKGPIVFWSTEEEVSYRGSSFKPKFHDQLLFVHLNKKADSAVAVKKYNALPRSNRKELVKSITDITEQIEDVTSLDVFSKILNEHEKIISKAIGEPTVKSLMFKDYEGSIKSLGAWGGDFVLATAPHGYDKAAQYFRKLGFDTVFKYIDLIL
jgi:mevalonate kinase